MQVLLTFTGFHDPYAQGLLGQEEQPEPILSLVSVRSFDRVILFSTPSTLEHTQATKDALETLYPALVVESKDLSLDDPTDYNAILRGLRTHLPEICDKFAPAQFCIAVASGTPHMHACWVLLAASGEIPARILHVRPPRFVTKDRPLVSEADLTSPDFPLIRTHIREIELPYEVPVDVETVVQQLGIVGDHPRMQQALEYGAALAPSSVPMLLLGETGTGKELFARYIHRLSGRPVERFVPINCAALPQELVESILFGHKRGAFTGAISDQKGKFAVADGGTLYNVPRKLDR